MKLLIHAQTIIFVMTLYLAIGIEKQFRTPITD